MTETGLESETSTALALGTNRKLSVICGLVASNEVGSVPSGEARQLVMSCQRGSVANG
jgi:hypothetical protein